MSDDAGVPLVLPDAPTELAGRPVKAWWEPVTMRTYEPGAPMEYPAYLSRRVYQGSSGAVYPLPLHEHICDEPRMRPWEAIHLENEYVRLMLLPELGGRIHIGYDKGADYDFFYRNEVIKPALVGLTGPWLAGGVEFNWPQHHRPATYLPTRAEIEQEPDGAVTVWCSDHDPFTRMKGMHGVRLRPGSSLIELRVRLTNRSEHVQTFMWWANVAAAVNDDYQSFFPSDVTHVADHAKRAVSRFPAVEGTYYGVDYAGAAAAAPAGDPDAWADAPTVDGCPPPPRDDAPDRIDWYHNIPVPTSYMAVGTSEDFFGGYDHGRRAGFVHWADHGIAPGKKQWTWGSSDFGHRWDRNLSDDGSAYVELMAGVFTDNQPDFSFLAPGETRTFSQYWYPISQIGPAQHADRTAATRLDCRLRRQGPAPSTTVRVGIAVTRPLQGASLSLLDAAGDSLWQHTVDLAPDQPFVQRLELDGTHERHSLTLVLRADDRVVLRWRPCAPGATQDPLEPATEPPDPARTASVDELVVAGLHLTQYRHASRSPLPYWEEALRRDPGHVQARTALGVDALRRGEYQESVEHLLHAVRRQTRWNLNPSDGEATYLLGLALRRCGDPKGALARFERAAWLQAWSPAATLERARLLAAGRTDAGDAAAEEMLRQLVGSSPHSGRARALLAVLLRRRGASQESQAVLATGLALDPLDEWLRWLSDGSVGADAQVLMDLVHESRGVGELVDALALVRLAEEADLTRAVGATAAAPLCGYVRAAVLDELGRAEEAAAARAAASSHPARWCFPVRLDDVDVLSAETRRRPYDARPWSLLGHWLYAVGRREEAAHSWGTAVDLDPGDAVAWRNLAVARYDVFGDADGAVEAYGCAIALRPDDDRLRFELDQLDQRSGRSPRERLQKLAQREDLVGRRDDLTAVYADLLTVTGQPGRAREVLAAHRFHPWEGGEGLALGAWSRAGLAIARATLGEDVDGALAAVRAVLAPPASLGETWHPLASSAEAHLVLGDVLAAGGRPAEAAAAWQAAAGQAGDFVDMAVAAYSTQTAWSIIAHQRLGDTRAGDRLRHRLVQDLEVSERTVRGLDYFATSQPSLLLFDEDVDTRRRREDEFVRAQLELVDGDQDAARTRLGALLAQEPSHIGAQLLEQWLEQPAPELPSDPSGLRPSHGARTRPGTVDALDADIDGVPPSYAPRTGQPVAVLRATKGADR